MSCCLYWEDKGEKREFLGKEVTVSITEEERGVGTYKCSVCGTTVRPDDSADTLSLCPICSNTEIVKVF